MSVQPQRTAAQADRSAIAAAGREAGMVKIRRKAEEIFVGRKREGPELYVNRRNLSI